MVAWMILPGPYGPKKEESLFLALRVGKGEITLNNLREPLMDKELSGPRINVSPKGAPHDTSIPKQQFQAAV